MKQLQIFITAGFIICFGCGDKEEKQAVTAETIDEMIDTVCEQVMDCESTMSLEGCLEELDYFVGCVTTDECFVIANDYLECLYEHNECIDGDYVVGAECDELEELVEDCCA